MYVHASYVTLQVWEDARENTANIPKIYHFRAEVREFNACVINHNFASTLHTDNNDAGWTLVHRMETHPDMEGGEFLFTTMGVGLKSRHGDLWSFHGKVLHGTAAFKNQPMSERGGANRTIGKAHVVCTAWFLSTKLIQALGGSIKKPLEGP
jgi:hypothetical protein